MNRFLPTTMVALLPVALVTGYIARGGSETCAEPTGQPIITPTERSVEAGFTGDMSVHHSQAVDMTPQQRAGCLHLRNTR